MRHSDRFCEAAQYKLVKKTVAGQGDVVAGVQFQCLSSHFVLTSGLFFRMENIDFFFFRKGKQNKKESWHRNSMIYSP